MSATRFTDTQGQHLDRAPATVPFWTQNGTAGTRTGVRSLENRTAQARMPTAENGTVLPRQVPYAGRRPREYLTPKEVGRLIAAALNLVRIATWLAGTPLARTRQSAFVAEFASSISTGEADLSIFRHAVR